MATLDTYTWNGPFPLVMKMKLLSRFEAGRLLLALSCKRNATIYTRGIIHRSGNAATKIDITKSACFNARIQLDGLNVYKTDASYKGKYIWTVFDVRKGFRKKCTFICEASNRLTKNKCRLQREVHRTLEIAQPHAESCTTMFFSFCG